MEQFRWHELIRCLLLFAQVRDALAFHQKEINNRFDLFLPVQHHANTTEGPDEYHRKFLMRNLFNINPIIPNPFTLSYLKCLF